MTAEIGSLSAPDGANTPLRRQQYQEQLDTTREVPVWERDDAPPGSTAESLLVFERGLPVRVAGPTHYVHLADGRIVGGFGGGTHYSEAMPDGTEKITRITGSHAG